MDIIEFAVNHTLESDAAETSLFNLNEFQLALVGGGNADISLD